MTTTWKRIQQSIEQFGGAALVSIVGVVGSVPIWLTAVNEAPALVEVATKARAVCGRTQRTLTTSPDPPATASLSAGPPVWGHGSGRTDQLRPSSVDR